MEVGKRGVKNAKKVQACPQKPAVGKLNYAVAQCEGRAYMLFNHAVLKAGKLLIEKWQLQEPT